MNMSKEFKRISEHCSNEIGRQPIERVDAANDQDEEDYAANSGVVPCATERSPWCAIEPLVSAVVPVLKVVPAKANQLAKLGTRAVVAGCPFSKDSNTRITLSPWARSMNLEDLGDASSWLTRGNGVKK
jgi:hypothetical protein